MMQQQKSQRGQRKTDTDSLPARASLFLSALRTGLSAE
jgi:hypothetical protein